MRRRAHRHHLRGFTLLEVVLVLSIGGALAVLFVPLLSNTGPMSSAIAARTSASGVIDAIGLEYSARGADPDPACLGTDIATGAGTVSTIPAFANPCSLAESTPDVEITAPTVPSADVATASVGALRSSDGTYRVAAVVAQGGAPGDPTAQCHAILRTLPGALETFVTYPSDQSPCAAAAALERLAPPDACAPGTGTSWRKACIPGT